MGNEARRIKKETAKITESTKVGNILEWKKNETKQQTRLTMKLEEINQNLMTKERWYKKTLEKRQVNLIKQDLTK